MRVGFNAQAIKLGDEYEYDTECDYSHYYQYTCCCDTYSVVWYLPEFEEGTPEYYAVLSDDFSDVIDWENPDKVK